MKIEEAIAGVTAFFNDLIGALIPGAIFAAALTVMHAGLAPIQEFAKLGEGTLLALTIAGLFFALGHGLLAIFEHCMLKCLFWAKILKKFDEKAAENEQSYKYFASYVIATQKDVNDQRDWKYHDLRSVALSVSTEAAALGRRFMFLSLLCNGIGTAMLIIFVDYLVCWVCFPSLLFAYDHVAPWYIQAILLIVTAWALFKRGEDFHKRAMKTPFAIAITELQFKKALNASKTGP